MGWRALYHNGVELREETHGRPVQDGEEGKLLVIAQEDYGHTVAIDLQNGVIALDYESLGVQNGTIELNNPKMLLWICDETNIGGEIFHMTTKWDYKRDENRRKVLDPDAGKFIKEGINTFTPLLWRPIWFTRNTNGIPTKVIGAQTTLPEVHGGKNLKKMVNLFVDGRIGID